MLILGAIITTQRKRLVERWKLEGGVPRVPGQKVESANTTWTPSPSTNVPLNWKKEDYILLPPGEIAPVTTKEPDYAGMLVVYDWDSKEIIWKEIWGRFLLNPTGCCFADGVLYVTDVEGASIFVIDVDRHPGRLLKRISHPNMSDLHSLERTSRGLLVTCSGNDSILEVDLDGNLLWQWWANEHGYVKTPSGDIRTSGRGLEHRDQYYHTRYQATHINVAVSEDPAERYILALLFHQGQLVRIDRGLPESDQHAQVIMDGLARPHALERFENGWTLANTLGKEILVLDQCLQVADRISYDGGWIQDSTRLSNGRLLLNDVDNTRLVEFAGSPYQAIETIPYLTDWRMGDLLEVPKQHEAAFRRARTVAAS
jgi:hypothetical protein